MWLFIDRQNFYRDARRALGCDGQSSAFGQVDFSKLGELLLSRSPQDRPRRIDRINVYVGIPSPDRDPYGNAAYMRQRQAWEAAGVAVHARPLAYRKDGQPEEKGVDVALAVDVVFNAARRHYDVAIIATTDTDILPALEAALDMRRAWGTPSVEVCSWRSAKKRLHVQGSSVWCHWLEDADYPGLEDPARYGKDPT